MGGEEVGVAGGKSHIQWVAGAVLGVDEVVLVGEIVLVLQMMTFTQWTIT